MQKKIQPSCRGLSSAPLVTVVRVIRGVCLLFLVLALAHVTLLCCMADIPYDAEVDEFIITIEFNHLADPTAFCPFKFHTCTKDFRVPGSSIFLKDYPTFCEKATIAINEAYNKFDMV